MLSKLGISRRQTTVDFETMKREHQRKFDRADRAGTEAF